MTSCGNLKALIHNNIQNNLFMEILLACQNLQKYYGAKLLFDDLSFSVHSQDRIGMLGPNGSGKSTLLKIIYDLEPVTEGKITKKTNLKVSYVPQEETFSDLSVYDVLFSLKPKHLEDYEFERIVEDFIEKCGFPSKDQKANSLSGGYQKRLSFAKAWIQEPNLMLLDEPTNHLDLDTLFWLEETLQNLSCALIIVSHDRYFLENTCNKIIEINRKYPKGCFIVDGQYHEYLKRKEAYFAASQQMQQHMKSKLKKEINWLNTSPKARTTKAESRVKEALALQASYSDLKKKNAASKIDLSLESSDRETNKLISIKNLTKSFGNRVLFKGLDYTVSPKTRLGVLGFNGSGKTTLLKTIAKEIQPDLGTLKYADNCKIVYFKQNREIFDRSQTLRSVLSPNSDYVTFQGVPTHINGFCKLIGFEPSDLDMPCQKLSGGEKARALIGNLMLQQADVLLLDEPTNDLDGETLDLFLDVLSDYQGAIVIISHDRFFLDSLCDEMIAIGLEENCLFFPNFQAFQEAAEVKKQQKTQPIQVKNVIVKSFQEEKKRLKVVLNKIETYEIQLKKLHDELESESDEKKIALLCEKIAKEQKMLDQLLLEWEKLETIIQGEKS
jgi:ATP-binding cassette subfamily F protein uup